MSHQHIMTYCRVCEPACGLIATVSEGALLKLEPDREHPVSQGFACVKGLAGVEVNQDPDRLNTPAQRAAGRLEERSWDEALEDIAQTLTRLLAEHGPQAIGMYMGNPASFNSMVGIGAPEVFARLGVDRVFSSSTQDTANKFAASSAVYGTSVLHPLPDIRNTDALLLLGSNWRVSKGTLLSMPNAYKELTDAAARGARIWFVNPRETETAGARTGETVPIKPDTDVYFLAALICEIDRTCGFAPGLENTGRHLEELREFVHRYPPERVAGICGLEESLIRTIAAEFAAAPSAAANMATGVNMGRQGTLAYWLLQMLVFVTGNLDVKGGNIPGREVYPNAAKAKTTLAADLVEGEFGMMRTGHLPGVLLADYILDAAEPVRALVVVAGNPLFSIPGEERLRQALARLELLVVIDIYPNATSELAHWLLPATDQHEREDINIAVLGMQPNPFVNWAPRVAEPQFERREEWWMFARLAQKMGVRSVLDAEDPDQARWGRVDHMLKVGGMSLAEVTAQPRGADVPGGLEPGRLYATHLQHEDGLVDCRPEVFLPAIGRCEDIFQELLAEEPGQLKLITRRDAKMQNSWYANLPGMKRGARSANPLAMNPMDAERLGVADGDTVRVRSEWGELTVSAQLDAALRPGVVSMEHGWGLQAGLRLSRERPGVNVNQLTPHGPGSYEPESNQAQLTGIPVEVLPACSAG